MFRCRRQVDGKLQLPVVLLWVPVGLKVGQEVVVPPGIWVDWCVDDDDQNSDFRSSFPKCHQHPV